MCLSCAYLRVDGVVPVRLRHHRVDRLERLLELQREGRVRREEGEPAVERRALEPVQVLGRKRLKRQENVGGGL